MSVEKTVRAAGRVLARLDELLVGVVFIFMLLVGLAAVLMRYVVQQPLTWSDEVNRYLLVCLTYAGALIATRRNSHIRSAADILGRLPAKARAAVEAAVNVLLIFFLVILIVKGTALARAMSGISLISLPGVPLVLVYGFLPVVAAVMAVHQILRLFRRKTPRSG